MEIGRTSGVFDELIINKRKKRRGISSPSFRYSTFIELIAYSPYILDVFSISGHKLFS